MHSMERAAAMDRILRPFLAIPFLFLLGLSLNNCAHGRSAGHPLDNATEISIAARPEVVIGAKRYRREYVLGAGDQLEISIRRFEGIKFMPVIRPDGYISLPLINDEIKAAGMTPRELTKRLVDLYSQRLVNPEVTVVVTQTRLPQVYVLGEVRNPVSVDMHNTLTAMQAIARAGGFNDKAAERSVMLVRIRDDGRLVAMRITPQLSGPEGTYLALNNVTLDPYDIIFVPKTTIAKVSSFFEDHINKIFSGLNAIVSTYTQFRLIELLAEE